MKTLKEINEHFLSVAKEVDEYVKYRNLQDQMLSKSVHTVDLALLRKIRIYLEKHQSVIFPKETWTKKEWQKICQARTFDYNELGNLLIDLFEKQELTFYYATRLVKSTIQIDEKKCPFYQVVSFITNCREDLDPMIFDELSKTMYPFYINPAFILKPLLKEQESRSKFEEMIRTELDARKATNVYVITKNDLPATTIFQKSSYQATLTEYPFSIINSELETIMETRYHQTIEFLTTEKKNVKKL